MNAGVSRTAFKLAVVQLRIEAALSHQCIMVTLLNDISILHDQNQIGIPDCLKAVRDNKARPSLHQIIHCLLNLRLSTGID